MAIALAILAALFYLGRNYFTRVQLELLTQANPIHVAAVAALFLLTRLLTGRFLQIALASLGHHISLIEAFLVTMLRVYTGLLVPRAGFGVAGIYLKMRHHVNLTHYTALVLPLVFLQCCAIGPLGIAGMVFLHYRYDDPISWPIVGIFVCATMVGVAALLFRFRIPVTWSGRIARLATSLADAWHLLGGNRGLTLRLVGLHFVMILLRVVRLYLAFQAIGLAPHFVGVLVSSLLADLAFMIGVTPNGLGLREATIVLSSRVIGVDQSGALMAALLDRIVTTLIIILVAQAALWKLGGRSREGP